MMVLRETLQRKVSLVLLLIDAYSGETILNGISVRTHDGLYQPIKKKDGYFVFVNVLTCHMLEIDIRSQKYEEHRLKIKISELNPLKPIMKIRLTPAFRSLPKGTTSLSGKAQPGDVVSIIYDCDLNTYKLLCDMEKGQNVIQLYNPANRDLEGEPFVLRDKWNQLYEQLTLIEKIGDHNTYKTSDFQASYKKLEYTLVYAATVTTKEDGTFFHPVPHFDDKNKNVTIYINGDLKMGQEIKLVGGLLNMI